MNMLARFGGLFQSRASTVIIAIPAGLAAFGIVASCLLVFDRYYTPLILLLGLPAAGLAAYAAGRVTRGVETPGSATEQRLCDVLVIVGVLLWTGFNIPFSSQHLFTDRDPATYAVAGAWLVTHNDLHIPMPQEFKNIPDVSPISLGFSASTRSATEIYAQGSHILPAFLGLAGRLLGYKAMLMTNVLFGGAALLAIYGYARLIMKPRWALGATFALGTSLPLLYFSRDTYTEPLALMCIFGSLSLLWYARQTGKYTAWILAGVLLGTGLLARIDTYLVLAAVALCCVFGLAISSKTDHRGLLLRQLAFGAVVGSLSLLAWLDLTRLSSGYYHDLRPQYIAEITLLGAILAAGAILTTLAWKTPILGHVDARTKAWRHRAGVAVLSLFFLFLASRSIWQVNYAMRGDVAVRTYAEHSLIWMTWYLGPVIAIIGIVATVWLWGQILHGKRLALLPFASVMAASSMYLVNPNITPDQIWAARRFLPVLLPGLAIMCFLILAHLYERKDFKIRHYSLQPQTATAILATLALVGPLFVSYPFIPSRAYAPQLSQMQFVCKNIPANALVVWVGDAKDYSIQPTQAFCGVPSVGISSSADLTKVLPSVAAATQKYNKHLVIGAKDGDLVTIPANFRAAMSTTSTITYRDVEHTYKKFPRNMTNQTQTLTFGVW